MKERKSHKMLRRDVTKDIKAHTRQLLAFRKCQTSRPKSSRGGIGEETKIKNSPSLMSAGEHEKERLDSSKILQMIGRRTMHLSCTKDAAAAEGRNIFIGHR